MIVKDGLIEYQIAVCRQKNIPFVAIDINEPGITHTRHAGKRFFCQIPAIYLDNATPIAINDRVIKFGRGIENISIHTIAAIQRILAATPFEGVIAAKCHQCVIAAIANQNIIFRAAKNYVISLAAFHTLATVIEDDAMTFALRATGKAGFLVSSFKRDLVILMNVKFLPDGIDRPERIVVVNLEFLR